jgi:hypothetical protein
MRISINIIELHLGWYASMTVFMKLNKKQNQIGIKITLSFYFEYCLISQSL